MIKININMPEDILKKTDKRAKQLGISRTAFITMAVSEKLTQSDVVDSLPEMLDFMKRMTEKAGQ